MEILVKSKIHELIFHFIILDFLNLCSYISSLFIVRTILLLLCFRKRSHLIKIKQHYLHHYYSILFLHEFTMNITFFTMKFKHHIYLTFQSKSNLLNDAFQWMNYLINVHVHFHYYIELNTIMLVCKERSDVTCLYDLAGFLCLCNEDRFSNCLHFNFIHKSHCQQKSVCENEGECFSDRTSCPNSMMYVTSVTSVDNERIWSLPWYHFGLSNSTACIDSSSNSCC